MRVYFLIKKFKNPTKQANITTKKPKQSNLQVYLPIIFKYFLRRDNLNTRITTTDVTILKIYVDSNLTVSAEHRQPTTQLEHKVLSEMIPLPKQFSFSFKIGCFIVKAAQEPKGNRFYSTRSNSLHSIFVAFLIFKSKSLIFISGSHFIPSREQHCLTDTKFPLTIPEICHVSQAHLGLC